MFSTENDFINEFYLLKMTINECDLLKVNSSMSSIHWKWLYQSWVLCSTEDGFFSECYLLTMNSSVNSIYWRWLHQWVISPEDEFINECYLLKMTSSIGAIYSYRRWLHQWVLFTEDDVINECYLLKFSFLSIRQRAYTNKCACSLPNR